MKKIHDRSCQHFGRKLCALAATVLLASSAFAQIPVPSGGSGVLTFGALPTVAEGWSSLSVGTSGGTYTDAATMDAAVIANTDAATVTTALTSSTTVPPSQNATARW